MRPKKGDWVVTTNRAGQDGFVRDYDGKIFTYPRETAATDVVFQERQRHPEWKSDIRQWNDNDVDPVEERAARREVHHALDAYLDALTKTRDEQHAATAGMVRAMRAHCEIMHVAVDLMITRSGS